MPLDAASLDAILQEARACFLYEDAPEHLALLEQGIRRITAAAPGIDVQAEYIELMRAAHTLKGGAGLAELTVLSQLAHQLEDLLQALQEGRVQDLALAYELLTLGIEQTQDLIAVATAGKQPEPPSELFVALNSFLTDLPILETSSQEHLQSVAINPLLLKTALEIDLEDCLKRVEQLLSQSDATALRLALINLVEECTLLGQTLNLAWLTQTADKLGEVIRQQSIPLKRVAEKAIAYIRQHRDRTLSPQPAPAAPKPASTPKKLLKPSSDAFKPEAEVNPVNLSLRIPVNRLDRMSNTVGELLINYERLSLYQGQLHQAHLSLRQKTQQMNPIRQQVQDFYDRMATPLAQNGIGTEAQIASDDEFDALEFDQYSDIHTTLQEFQELMVRIEESRTDIELISRDFEEGLEALRQQVGSLRTDLTESRLVPFKLLAERFVTQLETLNQRFSKSVELEVVGQDTPIDRAILEQLQAPLTHLFRNAFDHGIETVKERVFLKKKANAKITLSAAIKSNYVEIKISDDGRGIDLQKVYQKAIKLGFHAAKPEQVKPEQILDFLFEPGFSTAEKVTDISGRGVGLDVVRSQVSRLNGKVAVKTKLGRGTTFIITIPLTLSILPLLLCKCQQQTLAIPSSNVLEIIALNEFTETWADESITWRDRSLPLFPLAKLLPYHTLDTFQLSERYKPYLGVVLDIEGEEPIVVGIDSLVEEKELVLKQFDATVPVPAYIAGCTVLGTGEVVPVLYPSQFGGLIAKPSSENTASIQAVETNSESSRILVVDDSIAVRRLLNRILSESGYEVVDCRDGKEALEVLDRTDWKFDLAISDIEMPRLDGFTLLKEIRTHPQWHSLKVMMLTSRENVLHRQKAMSLGATAYCSKPFQATQLLKEIATLVEQNR